MTSLYCNVCAIMHIRLKQMFSMNCVYIMDLIKNLLFRMIHIQENSIRGYSLLKFSLVAKMSSTKINYGKFNKIVFVYIENCFVEHFNLEFPLFCI